jgi:glucose-1-phosphate adenylyltransferase
MYETAEDLARHSDLPPVGIGEGALIEKAIIDKNCRIGARAQVVNPGNQGDCEVTDFCSLRDGILVVEKDACLPDGWQAECLKPA